MPSFTHEIRFGRKAGKVVCGVDEVGRGPLAGPVVAAAAYLPSDFPARIRKEIRDSKKMSAQAREDIFNPLTENCVYAIAEASVEEIDRLNILWASMLAMERAVTLLSAFSECATIDVVLVDGNRAPKLNCPAFPIISGDNKSLSIAAASIIAKVSRDRFMKKLAREFPRYGWERNAGYGTSEHLEALTLHGVTVWHRSGFSPVREAAQLPR